MKFFTTKNQIGAALLAGTVLATASFIIVFFTHAPLWLKAAVLVLSLPLSGLAPALIYRAIEIESDDDT